METPIQSPLSETPVDLGEGYDVPINVQRTVDHRSALETTRLLGRTFARMYPQAGVMIDPLDVLESMKQAGVRCVLLGAHGIGGWMSQARATRDVDLVVRKPDHKKAVRAISRKFPDLVRDDHAIVTRFLDPATGEPVIDLMRPVDLYEHAFENVVQTELGHCVPNVELAIASKFRALVSRNRPEEKQHLDASDFIQIVKRNHPQVDRDRLRQLGEAVYRDGGEHLLKMVDDVLAGRRLRL
jgi:hypothetical protein